MLTRDIAFSKHICNICMIVIKNGLPERWDDSEDLKSFRRDYPNAVIQHEPDDWPIPPVPQRSRRTLGECELCHDSTSHYTVIVYRAYPYRSAS